MHAPLSFVFLGTPDIAVAALNALETKGLVPKLIVTAPDAPQGRGMTLTPPPVKLWAEERNIPVLQPTKLSDPTFVELLAPEAYGVSAWDAFVVVAYGKIIPAPVLALPKRGTLNMHPSLLPKHRGPSPIESQILSEQHAADVGVSIMLLDEAMDHGPVIAQERNLPELAHRWPVGAHELRRILAAHGGALLAETLPQWVTGAIEATEQDHNAATYCKKTKKEDAELDLSAPADLNYRKTLAYELWPRAFFYVNKNGAQTRVVVTEAVIEDGTFVVKKVIPEGRKEMSYDVFLRS